MHEEMDFLRESVVDVDAAVIGIASSHWTSIAIAEADLERAAQKMKSTRFDVLPIDDPAGVSEYFCTKVWSDYSSVLRQTIRRQDVITFNTPVHDVIRGFALESRNFYFLVNERRVVGLVSITNLNCRQTYVYLFSLLSELETQLGSLVMEKCAEQELLAMTFGSSENQKYDEVKKRYRLDKADGVEVRFVEYMYLSDLVNVIRKKHLFSHVGYDSGGKFQDALGPLVKLRDTVAHPSRSLIQGPESCIRLWHQIDEIETILFYLR